MVSLLNAGPKKQQRATRQQSPTPNIKANGPSGQLAIVFGWQYVAYTSVYITMCPSLCLYVRLVYLSVWLAGCSMPLVSGGLWRLFALYLEQPKQSQVQKLFQILKFKNDCNASATNALQCIALQYQTTDDDSYRQILDWLHTLKLLLQFFLDIHTYIQTYNICLQTYVADLFAVIDQLQSKNTIRSTFHHFRLLSVRRMFFAVLATGNISRAVTATATFWSNCCCWGVFLQVFFEIQTIY